MKVLTFPDKTEVGDAAKDTLKSAGEITWRTLIITGVDDEGTILSMHTNSKISELNLLLDVLKVEIVNTLFQGPPDE